MEREGKRLDGEGERKEGRSEGCRAPPLVQVGVNLSPSLSVFAEVHRGLPPPLTLPRLSMRGEEGRERRRNSEEQTRTGAVCGRFCGQ